MVRAWSVTARGQAAVRVRGRNWIVALGRGLDELGRADDLRRLACEVLPNGTVIARDVTTGVGYVVQAIHGDAPGLFELTDVRSEPDPAEPLEISALDDQTSELPMPTDDPTESIAEPPPAEPPSELTEPGIALTPEEEEEERGEPIFILPADAIDELTSEDDPGYAILDAESRLEACRLALERARTAVGAESGAVILEERGMLRFFAVEGPHAEQLLGSRLPLGTGVAGFAMEQRRSLVLSDARQDPRHNGEVDALTGYTTQQIAVVPVVARNRALGVLELMNLPDGRQFTDSDLSIVRQFADALAVRLSR